jgi:hypothetical protein
MLLASPVRIEAEDLDLELDLPEPEGRVRVLGRIAREAPEVGWPYVGYGIEFLFLPESGQRAIDRMVKREALPEPAKSLWAPGAIHSTLRRDAWIYEITEPARTEAGFLVEVRRGVAERRPRRAFASCGSRRARPRCGPRVRAPPADPPLSVPRLSVLLPVRDAAASLDACLDSLAAQTLADHEVVAVDDGSRDGSGELLRARARSDPRLRVLCLPPRGLVPALNLALGEARAPLVARMDADDRARRDRLTLQAERLGGTPRWTSSAAGSTSRGRPLHRRKGCEPTSAGRTPSSTTTRWRATVSSSRPSSTPQWP